LSFTTTERSTSSSSLSPIIPPYGAGELSSSSVLDLLAGLTVLALMAESQPERRPEGGWFDFLGFLGKGGGLWIQKKTLVQTLDA
jgi:hypothetical protein